MAEPSLAQGSGSSPPRRRRKSRKPPKNPTVMPPEAQHNGSRGCPSDAQVAASNQTLNFMLGSRRQPSWMTMAQHSKPSSNPPHPGTAPVSSNHQGSAVRGPPSRTSIISDSDTNRLSIGALVTPPISNPVDGPQSKPAPIPASGQHILSFPYPLASSEMPRSFPSPEPQRLSLTSSGSDWAAALPSPAPTDQPSPPIASSNQDSHRNPDSCVQSPDLGQNHSVNIWNAIPPPSGGALTRDQDPARCEPSNTPQDRSQDTVSASQSVAPPPMPTPATIADPQRQSGQAVTSPPLNGQLAVPVHHPPRPPSQGNNDSLQTVGLPEANAHPEESLRPKVMAENLTAFISSLGGLNKLPDDGTSLPRVQLLKEAIETGDYFYIILHHVLCIWSIDGEAAYRLLGLAPDVAGNALGIVQNTLRKNENMTQELVRFFANFPNSWASGLWETEAFRKHVGDVSIFLNNLHEQWNRIHIPAMRPRSGRGYPILADELRYQLKLRSPLLENIFFTVTRRHIGVPDGPIADQMAALFRQDAENDHAKMSEHDQRVFQQSLISRYKQLVHQNDRLQQQQQQQQQQRRLRQQTNPLPASGAQQPLSQNVAMPRQLNMPEPGRRSSTSFLPTQTTIASPTQVSSVQGFNMDPSPPVQNPHQFQRSFPGNIAQVPSQLRMQCNNPSLINSGIQPPMQQGPMRMPQMLMGQMNQAPTPAGSPHYANVQLPQIHSCNSQGFQQASNPRRQTAQQEYQHRHVQAIVQRQAANLASSQTQQVSSPRLQQAHQMQQVSRQRQSPTNAVGHPQMNPNAQGAIPGAAPAVGNHQVSRPPAARSRVSRDVSGRLRGNVFPPPHTQISLDRLPHIPWEPKALSIALHQVEVRSPRRVPRDPPDATKSGRYYQSIKKLAVGPVATRAEQALHRLVFVVPKEDIGKLCSNRTLTRDGLPVSEYFDGSLRYRLRLCELPVNPGDPTKIAESTWAVAQTHWPDHINILVNGKVMTIRRKQHNGQHQPVELTPFILAGTNSISVAISPPSRPLKPNTMYYMAVEIIETLGYENIIDMVLQHGVISADATRAAIRKRLKPVTEDGDDELAVVGNDLSIDLADPFSATMFQIPVRGASCMHMECFDLATWLQTRPAKPKCTIHGAGDDCRLCNRGFGARPEPSLVDKWKCPLCDGDARPYSLRKDDFMAEVRSVLEKEGKLHTKTIYVAADGGWRAKVEEVGDEEDEEAEDEQPPTKRVKTRATPSEVANAVEVIELD